jgi:protein-S-isoprenylcysteine O-methyltransferase Ste14
MNTAQAALPRRRQLIRALIKLENTIPALVWLFLVFFQVAKVYEEPWVSTIGLLLINGVAMVLFVTRRDASRVGNFWEGVLAVSGTFVVTLLLIVANNDEGMTLGPGASPVATIVQCIGIAGWAVSLLALGRSLGIAPADRGLVRHGPYRFIRHPIYAFEALFFVGWVINVRTVEAAIIVAVWAVLQIGRIIREERIIGGYDEYSKQVRWRLIPLVW